MRIEKNSLNPQTVIKGRGVNRKPVETNKNKR
jgi:hypothetical protein